MAETHADRCCCGAAALLLLWDRQTEDTRLMLHTVCYEHDQSNKSTGLSLCACCTAAEIWGLSLSMHNAAARQWVLKVQQTEENLTVQCSELGKGKERKGKSIYIAPLYYE